MREIKFRVCTIDKMFYIVNGGEYQLTFGMGSDWSLWDEEGEICNSSESDTKIMQYTGLKDKNGKEIYEGDILKYTSNERVDTRGSYKNSYAVYKDIEIIGVVKFGEFKDNLMFYIDSPQSVSYDSYFFSDSKNRAPRTWTDKLSKPLFPKKEYEVIGNIYENPELLESGQHE